MHENTPVLERAFQLAESGKYPTVTDIKRRLTDEGYSIAHVTGGQISKQLMALIKTSRAKQRPRDPKGEQRPADVIGAAIKVARIATGEIVKDTKPDDGKDKVEALHTPVLRSQTRSPP